MNQNIQNSLFETMKIFSDNAKETSDAALIIECIIREILNEGIGEYNAEYLGNTFSVYASNINNTYRVDDKVYVAIPEGDFTKTKMIIGFVNPEVTTFTKQEELDSIYYEVSDNFVDTDLGTIDLSSYDTTRVDNIKISKLDSDEFNIIFNDYLGLYNTFKISFLAKTELNVDQQNGGNYGIALTLPLIAATAEGSTETIYKQYVLDSTNMLGNYYRFETWTSQEVYFAIDKSQYQLANKDITLSYYCYGFPQDESLTSEKDIHIKDVSFTVVKNFITDNETGTGISIKASQGIYFSEQFDNKKTLTPTLRINSKKVKLVKDKCEVYWFKEDASVRSGTDHYNIHGGDGWRCLNEKIDVKTNDDGTTTFNWDPNLFILDLEKKDVPASVRYKCIIVYNNIEASGMITLKNLSTNRKFELKLKNGSLLRDTGYANIEVTVDLKDITSGNKEQYRNSIFYSWMRHDKDNILINTDDEDFFEIIKLNELTIDGKYITEMRFPVNRIEDVNYLYCSPRIEMLKNGKIEEESLGTKMLVLSTSDEVDYMVDVIGDNLVYKYDANGNSPVIDAYDGPSTSKVTSIVPLSYTILKPTGEEFLDSEYQYVYYEWTIPKQSMFSIIGLKNEEYKDEYGWQKREDNNNFYLYGYGKCQVPYTLATRYNVSRAKSNISLKVAFQDREIMRIVNISFLKDGEGGTNGTSFAAMLTYGNSSDQAVPYGYIDSNGVAQKLKFLYNTNNGILYYYDTMTYTLKNWSYNTKYIYPKVYKDGVPLTINDYEIKCTMFNSEYNNPCFIPVILGDKRIRLDRNNITPSINSCNILQVEIKVKIANDSILGREEIIYAYYPLELTICNFTPDIVPSIDGGFAEVMYAPDGTNPAWDQTAPFTINDAKILAGNFGNFEFGDLYFTSWFYSNHISSKESSNISTKATPDNKYDDGDAKNYIISSSYLTSSALNEVNNLISSQNSERSSLVSENNKVDANLDYLRNFANAYKGKEWRDKLDQIQVLLDRQTSGVYALNTLLNKQIDKLNFYIETKKDNGAIPIICQDLINQKSILVAEAERAVIQIQKLDGSIGYDYDNLISLVNYKLKWNDDIKNQYVNSLGLDAALNFELLINDINEQINIYQNCYNALISLKSTNYTTIYKQVVDDIKTMCDKIPNNSNVYSNITDLKNKILIYVNNFNNCTSYKQINEYIDLMYENVLKSMFKKVDEVLSINAIAQRYFSNIKDTNIRKINQIDNNLICLRGILNTQGYTFTHIRPIVFYYNRYSMSNINGWDGNKLDTGTNNEYLLAPQVGAGKKENGQFTGIVIGQKNFKDTSSQNQTGLFGYTQGIQSMFLNAENGSAIFGKFDHKGSQIIIDPSATARYIDAEGNEVSGSVGMLYSGNYFKNYNKYTGLPNSYTTRGTEGMCINLSGGVIHFGSSGAVIYSGEHNKLVNNKPGFYLSQSGLSIGDRFQVDTKGIVFVGKDAYKGANNNTAKCWRIDGSENSENSYIAYQTKLFNATFDIIKDGDDETTERIDKNSVKINGKDKDIYLGTDGIRLGKKFVVNADGYMYAKGGLFDGYLMAQAGEFDGPIEAKSYIKGGRIIGAGILLGKSNGTDDYSNGYLGIGYTQNGDIPVKDYKPSEKDFVFYVNSKGYVSMQAGKIILNKQGDSDENAFHIDDQGNLYVNGTSPEKASFGVTNTGKVYINDGSIDLKNEGKSVFHISDDGSMWVGKIGNDKVFEINNKGKVTIKSGSFTIMKDKKIVFKIADDGTLTATTGNIGSWLINHDGSLCSSDEENNTVILDAYHGKISLIGKDKNSDKIVLDKNNSTISLGSGNKAKSVFISAGQNNNTIYFSKTDSLGGDGNFVCGKITAHGSISASKNISTSKMITSPKNNKKAGTGMKIEDAWVATEPWVESWVNTKLVDYATTDWVTKNFAKKSDIPNVSSFVTARDITSNLKGSISGSQSIPKEGGTVHFSNAKISFSWG